MDSKHYAELESATDNVVLMELNEVHGILESYYQDATTNRLSENPHYVRPQVRRAYTQLEKALRELVKLKNILSKIPMEF